MLLGSRIRLLVPERDKNPDQTYLVDLKALTADKLAEISAYAGAWLRSRTPVFEPAGFPLTRRLTLLAFVKLVSSVRH